MNTILLFAGGIGFQEILLIGLFVLLLFGAKKIPEFMRGIGKGVREFQDGVKGIKEDMEHQSEVRKNETAAKQVATERVE